MKLYREKMIQHILAISKFAKGEKYVLDSSKELENVYVNAQVGNINAINYIVTI